MDKIKLFDGTTFKIENGAYLQRIIHKAASAAAAAELAAKITDENLIHMEVYHGTEICGSYDNLGVEEGFPVVDGTTVTISLYYK